MATQKPLTPSLTGNPGLDSLLGTGMIAASTAAAVWIAATLKISDPNVIAWIGAAVLAILGLVATGTWRYIKGTQVGALADRMLLIGTTAGIKMTAAGGAVAEDGVTVVSINDGSTPPKAPTVETSRVIAANFGPSESEITDALNASQLKGKP